MNIFLIYLLKVNIALSIVFALYLLLFRNNTLFKSKRVFLLSLCAFSLIYPFVSVPIENPIPFLQNINYVEEVDEPYYNVANFAEVTAKSPQIGLSHILLFLYLTVVSILFIRFIIQWVGLTKTICKGQSIHLLGHKVVILSKKMAPFSFFSNIIIDKETSLEKDVKEILIHEQAHVDQKHSIDVVFSEIFTIFCWFNPLTWFLRKEIRLNLEYLADSSVIRSGYNIEQYQFHILRLSYPMAIAKLYTGFNFSPLKKRIKMMNTKKSTAKAYFRYILFIPVIAALLLVNQRKVEAMPAIPEVLVNYVENPVFEASKQALAKSEKQTPTKPAKEKIYEHVEVMPQYPGGDKAFVEFVQRNVVYPVKAQEQKIQGVVRIRFVVKKDGSVGEIQIMRSLDPECDKAAVEAIGKSSKWTPGTMKGLPVNVWYNVPVNFKMAVDSQKTPASANQKSPEKDAKGRYYHVEQIPQYPGGETAFLRELQSNMIYPVKAQEEEIQGVVRLRFVVEKDGSIGEIQISRSLDPLCDNAAANAVKKSVKKWIPGKMNGKPVPVWYNCPVRFELQGDNDGQTPTSGASETAKIVVVGYK